MSCGEPVDCNNCQYHNQPARQNTFELSRTIMLKLPTFAEVEAHVSERLKREGVTNEGAVQMAYYFIRRQLQQ